MVVVVALAVGLSVASRNITNIRTSTQTEQSQRAFSAAEGGVEDVLSRLNAVTAGLAVGEQTTVDVPVGSLTAKVTIAKSILPQVIEEGNVAQFDLAGAAGTIQIEWALTTDGEPASIEVTRINGPAPYSLIRKAWAGISGRTDESGFSTTDDCTSSSGYSHCVQMDLGASPTILRIRPFWNRTTVNVSGASIPAQSYEITSTSNTQAGITRKVNVTRSVLPQLPASFDYALFSEGDIVK
ncbi:MAG: hypothetical protein Q8P25_00445 [Candidatus Curtissbacteria bacterium]|nr:hypothetical protein [Candidatus Curtissbacteria bacterium]